MEKRVYYLDLLKFIGLLCIILAHVSPPSIVFQIRNFDVILLILISSYLGLKTFKKVSIRQYIIKRFARLVLPTWIFLTIFFVVVFILKIIGINSFGIKDIFLSYSLSNYGIGYVWIIRIYFTVALLIPIYKYLESKLRKELLLIISIAIYYLYELLCHYGFFSNVFVDYFFAYIIPLFLLINISNYLFNNNKKIYLLLFVSMVLFLVLGCYYYHDLGHFLPTQVMKYPFRSYYLSYALFASCILILIFKKVKKINPIIVFVCDHSLWFYLWHILVLYVFRIISFNWYIDFIIIFIISLTIVFIQSKFILILKQHGINAKLLKIFSC